MLYPQLSIYNSLFMNNLYTLSLSLLISLLTIPAFAQEYLMTDGETTTTCGGTFYDSGGAAGNYGNNENLVHTFCPDDPTDCMLFNFSTFRAEVLLFSPIDILSVYDGTSTADPLIRDITGNLTDESFFVASTSGCITFEFISDVSTTQFGWEASVNCIPCPLPPDISQQDCIGAIPVCNEFYYQPNSYLDAGIHTGEVNPAISCFGSQGEKNSVWYVLNVQQTGDLSFIISPVDDCEDYDWILWDITDAQCSDTAVEGSPATLVSCNYSDSQVFPIDSCPLINNGQTGASSDPPYNGTESSQTDVGTPYNQSIPVEEGHTYAMIVSNFSDDNQEGYFLDFRSSSAVLLDMRPPEITNVQTPLQCWDLPITFEFSEPVLCSSIQQTDFQITQPDGTFINFATPGSNQCTNAETTTDITFFMAPRITQTGTHTLTIVGEIEDNCGNIGTGTSFEFYVETIDVDGGADITFCNGEAPTTEIGGSPTSAMATQYLWTSDPPSGASFLADNDVANPDFINAETMPIGNYSFFVEATILADPNNPNSGCTAIDTVSVTVENCGCDLTITNTNSTAAECNAATGEAVVSTSGGTAPLTYNWEDTANPGTAVSTTNPATGLSPGTFSVTVTDFFGCEATETVEVADFSGPVLSNPSSVPATCGMSNGQVSVEVTGGSGIYAYQWENTMNPGTVVSNANPATGLPTGNYTVTVTNADGTCPLSLSVFLDEDNSNCCDISVNNTEIENATCGLSNGTVTLTPNSSNVITNIEWQDINMPGVVIELGNVASDLPEGTYTYTITDNGGCTFTDNVTITGTPGLSLSNPVSTNSTCGATNGTAEVTANGAAPYTYIWEDTANPGTTVSTTNPATGLPAGTYNVTVTDNNNCTAIETVGISDANGPVISNPASTNALCGNATGVAGIMITGGAMPYTINWENTANPGVSVSTSETAINLVAGTYTVNVSDANGCGASATIEVMDTPGPEFGALNITAPENCAEDTLGTVMSSITGGVPPYTFGLVGTSVTFPTIGGGFDFSTLPGTYEVYISDASGCADTITFNIPDIEKPLIDMIETMPTTCGGDNGTINISASGGELPYQYSIDGGQNYQTNNTFNNLPFGNYQISIIDNNNCEIFEINTTNIAASQALSLTSSSQNASCGNADGMAMITVNQGTSPYMYNWEDAANPGTSISTNDTANTLLSGTYNVTVTDDAGCTATETINISDEGGPVISNPMTTGVDCGATDGTAEITISGGAMPYTITWENAANPGVTIGTTNALTGLAGGTYNVVVSDANACSASETLVVPDTGGLTISNPVTTNADCSEPIGTAQVTVTGGTEPYDYSWESTTNPGTIVGTTNPANGLFEGTYTVFVSDANGCSVSETMTVNGTDSPTILGIQSSNSTCGNQDGSVTLLVGQGTEPYSYNWENTNNPGTSVSTDPMPSGLAAGTYSFTVTDANTCTVTSTATVSDEGGPDIFNVTVQNATCAAANGAIIIEVSGGTLPYIYNWEDTNNPGVSIGTSDVVTDLAEGEYTVVVTDAVGCSTFESVVITDTEGLSIETNSSNPTCGENNGAVAVLVMGGTYYYTYQWSDGSTTQAVDSLPAGTYTLTVTDTDGCMGTAEIVLESGGDIAFETNVLDAGCSGSQDGTITVQNVSGGTAPYLYAVGGMFTTDSIFTNLNPGTYDVIVQDAEGCEAATSATIATTSTDIILFETSVTDADCLQSNNGTITVLNVSGGAGAPYLYSVGGIPGTDSIFTDLSVGTYEVIVQDSIGCQASTSVNIQSASTLELDYGDEVSIDLGESVDLFPTANFPIDTVNYTWEWSQDSTLIFNDFPYNPTAQPVTTTTYTVTVTNSEGCTVSDEITIRIRRNRDVFIPNVFSPNFDGKNDVFMIYGGIGISQISSMQVFNRWGDMVFENTNFGTDDPAQGWDGTHRGRELNPGAYVYYIVVEFIDGTTDTYRGDVTIVK